MPKYLIQACYTTTPGPREGFRGRAPGRCASGGQGARGKGRGVLLCVRRGRRNYYSGSTRQCYGGGCGFGHLKLWGSPGQNDTAAHYRGCRQGARCPDKVPCPRRIAARGLAVSERADCVSANHPVTPGQARCFQYWLVPRDCSLEHKTRHRQECLCYVPRPSGSRWLSAFIDRPCYR